MAGSHRRLALAALVTGTLLAPAPALSADGDATSPWFPLPLVFEPNVGQAAPSIRFLARGACYRLLMMDRELVVRFSAPVNERVGADLHVRFVGASAHPRIRSLGAPGWRAAVVPGEALDARRTYPVVRWSGLYPGIELRHDGSSGLLEERFTVAPGSQPGLIRLGLGTTPARVEPDGHLALWLPRLGWINLSAPVAYQLFGGEHRPVPVRYVLVRTHLLSLRVGEYDHRRPLLIEPTFTEWCNPNAGASDVAFDGDGNAYVSGNVSMSDESTVGFLTKLNRGLQPVWTTYFSGRYSGTVRAVAADQTNGHAYVAGAVGEPHSFTDAFVGSVDYDGRPLWSRVLGGARNEAATNVVLDRESRPVVAGLTASADFPTTSSALPRSPEGIDVFVARMSAGGGIGWATTFGGDANDDLGGIGVDSSGDVYVAGTTDTESYPRTLGFPTTPGSFQPAGSGGWDAFVVKLAPDGSRFLYSTFLGGSSTDRANAITVDQAGVATLTGWTTSDGTGVNRTPVDFPTTPDAIMRVENGTDAYVTKLDPSGSRLVYSTLIGSPTRGSAVGYDVTVDGSGRTWVVGDTWRTDFPVTPDAIQLQASPLGSAFVTALSPDGSHISYSTYYGGSSNDVADAIAVDDGSVLAVGATASPEIPWTLRGSGFRGWAGFILRFPAP